MKIATVTKNEKREIIVIKDEKEEKRMYAWIEDKMLTIVDLEYQRKEEKLILTKEELEELFPSLTIKRVKMKWNYNLCKCQVIPIPLNI